MSLTINLRHLEKKNLEINGEMTPQELGIEGLDELIKMPGTLKYAILVQKMESSLLLQGDLTLELACECARCLKPFTKKIELTDWACHVPLSGDEAVPINSDSVDLTPFLREDIILSFPQHPLCESECGGLKSLSTKVEEKSKHPGVFDHGSSAWDALNKLKLNE